MADMTMITAGLNSLKAAIDIAKFLKESSSAIDKAVMDNKLAELYSELAETKMKFVDLKEALTEKDKTIKELEEAFDSRDSLIRSGDAYYKSTEDGKPFGVPYCLKCWETNHKHRQLVTVQNNVHEKVCACCGHKYNGVRAVNIRVVEPA
jgi:hypothetical protein